MTAERIIRCHRTTHEKKSSKSSDQIFPFWLSSVVALLLFAFVVSFAQRCAHARTFLFVGISKSHDSFVRIFISSILCDCPRSKQISLRVSPFRRYISSDRFFQIYFLRTVYCLFACNFRACVTDIYLSSILAINVLNIYSIFPIVGGRNQIVDMFELMLTHANLL